MEAGMGDSSPPDDDKPGDDSSDEPADNPVENPFAGIPIFDDLGSMLSSQTDVWANAAQLAKHVATGGSPESNVDPIERATLEQLVRVAELHVASVTGLDPTDEGSPAKLELVTRSHWSDSTLERCKPLLMKVSDRLAAKDAQDSSDIQSDFDILAGPGGAIFEQLNRFIQPIMMGVCAGSTFGNLAQTVFGDYGLLLPTNTDTISLVGPNISDFGKQWSLDISGVLLWVCIRQLGLHTVFSVPHVRSDINALVDRYISGFRYDPAAVQRQLQEQIEQSMEQSFEQGLDPANIDPANIDPAAMQQEMFLTLPNPELLLGIQPTDYQANIAAVLGQRLALIDAYVNYVLEAAGHRLITSYSALTEALRRRDPMNSTAEQLVSQLFGIGITTEQRSQAAQFVAGVIERAGDEGLALLWSDPSHWPTPNEISAAGLWLARIELTS